MCNAVICPLKETCYRYKAAADEYQSYFMTPPYDFISNKCDYYITFNNNKKMKTAKELYPEYYKEELENGSFYGPYEYTPILEQFGDIIYKIDDKDWQGDSRVFYKKENKYGFLIFGWGSCSGCDALQACATTKDIQSLIDQLNNDIKWFDSLQEIKKYFSEKDWGLEFCGHQNETKKFIKFVENYEEMTILEMIEDWRLTFGLPVHKTVQTLIEQDDINLAQSLVTEEYIELMEAVDASNVIEIADGIGDMLFVLIQLANIYGIDVYKVVKAVYDSNMSKLVKESDIQATREKYKEQGIELDFVAIPSQTEYEDGAFTRLYVCKNKYTGKVLKSVAFKEPDFSFLTNK